MWSVSPQAHHCRAPFRRRENTVTLGLLRALRRRGLAVQPFNADRDYIDPAFHESRSSPEHIIGQRAMGAGLIATLAATASMDAEISVAEGVMGLSNGAAVEDNRVRHDRRSGVAVGWPVVVVLDVTGQTKTAAAVALGCARYRYDIDVAGVILNRVRARASCADCTGIERISCRFSGRYLRDERSLYRNGISALVQAREMRRSTSIWTDLPMSSTPLSMLMRFRRSARSAKFLPAQRRAVK